MSSVTVKCYEWSGTDSLSLYFTINEKKVNILFPPGKEKPKVNARYETSDPVIQEKIEGCYLFKVGHIKVAYTRNIVQPVSVVESPAAGVETKVAPARRIPYPSVTDYQQASDKLIEKYKIPADQLSSPEAILAKAEEVGALFPNLIL